MVTKEDHGEENNVLKTTNRKWNRDNKNKNKNVEEYIKKVLKDCFRESTFESIFNRRSIRKYKQKPVEWEKLSLVLEAARFAPSSGNLQNWRFVVVTNKETIRSIAKECIEQLWIEEAPIIIVILSKDKVVERHYGDRGKSLYAIQNCAMAAQNMMLAAHALGLSSCFVGAFYEEGIKSILNISQDDNVSVQGILTIGYGNETPETPERYSLEDLTFLEFYHEPWGKIKDIEAVSGYRWARLVESIIMKLDKLKSKSRSSKNKSKVGDKIDEISKKIKSIFK